MKRKIIGARVRLLATVKNRGGHVINKGEEATIDDLSHRGHLSVGPTINDTYLKIPENE